MRTLKQKERNCYFCGLGEEDKYTWIFEEEDGVEAREIKTEVVLVEIERVFDKGARAVFFICKRCCSLLAVAESAVNYRYRYCLPEKPKIG